VSAVVVKLGGHTLDDLGPDSPVLIDLASDLAELKAGGNDVVLVHGGGPQIAGLLAARGLQSSFVDGLRVTDDETMECVSMALGYVNQKVCAALSRRGLPVMGLSGADSQLLLSSPLGAAWGRAGSSPEVGSQVLGTVLSAGLVPVVSPVAVDSRGELLNCNADTAAGAIAAALGAELILLSDVDQIRSVPDDPSTGLADVDVAQVEAMVTSGAIRDGMRPKVQAALDALGAGAPTVQLANGTKPHALRDARANRVATTKVHP